MHGNHKLSRRTSRQQPQVRQYPLAYLITLRTFGTWQGAKKHRVIELSTASCGAKKVLANRNLHQMMVETQRGPAFRLDAEQQKAVTSAIEEFCKEFRLPLRAIRVTPSFVNVVMTADVEPEDLIDDLRSATIFKLMNLRLVGDGVSIWSSARFRHFLWDENAIQNAVQYTQSHMKECLPIFDDWLRSRSN